MLNALNLSPNMRLSLITRLDCRNQGHSIFNLRLVSVELLGIYRDVLPKTSGGAVTDMAGLNSPEGDINNVMVAAKKNL